MRTDQSMLRSWSRPTLFLIFIGITLILFQGCTTPAVTQVVCMPGGGEPGDGPAPCYSHAAKAGEKAEDGTPCNLQGRVCNTSNAACTDAYGQAGTCHTKFQAGKCGCVCVVN
jgi:uncharacterized iron-regulated membrane protein